MRRVGERSYQPKSPIPWFKNALLLPFPGEGKRVAAAPSSVLPRLSCHKGLKRAFSSVQVWKVRNAKFFSFSGPQFQPLNTIASPAGYASSWFHAGHNLMFLKTKATGLPNFSYN